MELLDENMKIIVMWSIALAFACLVIGIALLAELRKRNKGDDLMEMMQENSVEFGDWLIHSGYIPDVQNNKWRLRNEVIKEKVENGELVELQFYTLHDLYQLFLKKA